MDLEAMTDDELLNEAKKQGYNPDGELDLGPTIDDALRALY